MKKIILLFIPIILTGCNYVELNDLAIASSIGIDYDKELNNYNITVQIMNTNSNEGKLENKAIIYEEKGKTLTNAINNFSLRYPKNLYLGHLEMCILGSDAIKYKLDSIFDYLIRESSIKSSCYVLVSNENKASEILNPKNENEKGFPTEDLKSILIDSTNKTGTTTKITLEEFLSEQLKKGIDPVLPTVVLKNDNKPSKTSIDKLITIKNNKIKNSLNKNQSIALNSIKENYQSTNINIKYKNDIVSFDINNPKSNLDVKIKNNKIITTIKLDLEAHTSETNKRITLNNRKRNNYFIKEINKIFKSYIKELIIYNKQNNTDNIGIKNILYKNSPKKYNKYKSMNPYNLNNINIKVKTNIYVHGNINKGAF